VAVVDSSANKVAAARLSGATAEPRGVDAAIVLTVATAAIPEAFRALRRNCRLILVGLSTSSYELPSPIPCSPWRCKARSRPTCTLIASKTPALLEQMRSGELAGRAVIEFC
jgi:threonine dehydrogenase-like Zn-dependent dehydrogenase